MKKENITKENISEILLCQIPSVNSVSAKAILQKFDTLHNVMTSIREDPTCLSDIICTTKGKTRKISRNVIQNIHHYLGD